MCELLDVDCGPAGDLSDRGRDCRCLPAPVVRVVLQEVLDLPRWQDALQTLGEHVGRYVDEGDIAAERGGERGGDFRVGDGRGAGQGVGRAVVAGFGERGGRPTAAMSRTSTALIVASPIGA